MDEFKQKIILGALGVTATGGLAAIGYFFAYYWERGDEPGTIVAVALEQPSLEVTVQLDGGAPKPVNLGGLVRFDNVPPGPHGLMFTTEGGRQETTIVEVDGGVINRVEIPSFRVVAPAARGVRRPTTGPPGGSVTITAGNRKGTPPEFSVWSDVPGGSKLQLWFPKGLAHVRVEATMLTNTGETKWSSVENYAETVNILLSGEKAWCTVRLRTEFVDSTDFQISAHVLSPDDVILGEAYHRSTNYQKSTNTAVDFVDRTTLVVLMEKD